MSKQRSLDQLFPCIARSDSELGYSQNHRPGVSDLEIEDTEHSYTTNRNKAHGDRLYVAIWTRHRRQGLLSKYPVRCLGLRTHFGFALLFLLPKRTFVQRGLSL